MSRHTGDGKMSSNVTWEGVSKIIQKSCHVLFEWPQWDPCHTICCHHHSTAELEVQMPNQNSKLFISHSY